MHSAECNKVTEFVSDVCKQIRWKMAHQRVADEMAAHIEDSRIHYIEQGMSDEAATNQAIADTGDSTLIGADFDRIHRPRPQWGMLLAVAAFLAIGIIAHFALRHVPDLPLWPQLAAGSLNRRLVYMAVGITVMFGLYFLDFTIIGKYSVFVYIFVILLFAAAILLWPSSLHFSRFGVIMQAFSLVLPLAYAGLMYGLKGKGMKGVIIAAVAFSAYCFLAAIAVFLSALFLFLIAGVAILAVAIYKNWFGYNRTKSMVIVAVPAGLFALLGVLEGWSRLQTAIFPMRDPLGWGFVGHTTRQIIQNAVWLGESEPIMTTLHRGTEYHQHNIFLLPSPLNDMLLTSIISQFGWLPFIAIIAALVAFIAYGFVRCFRQKSGLGFFVSFAVMLTFTVQAAAYVAYNMGFTFVLLSLPLMSPGNAAMVVNLGLIGIMLSVFRSGDVVKDMQPEFR